MPYPIYLKIPKASGRNLNYAVENLVIGRSFSVKQKSENHYEVLGLKKDADQESVRRAFVALCKIYHPDSGNPNASADKFHEIESAYRALQSKFVQERWDTESHSNDVKEFDIRHTAPQHREYLSWDGIGIGTPSQRQQQYNQFKAARAASRVLQHRIDKLEEKGNELTSKDRQRVKDIKTGLGMDRIVEDLIQESMSKGEFSNLSGSGKPLKEKIFNHHVDFITQKVNEILIENGFTPEWISLAKEIEEDLEKLRRDLRNGAKFGSNSVKWDKTVKEAESSVKAINKKIQSFNLIVPILNRQMFLVQLKIEIEKALADCPETDIKQTNDLKNEFDKNENKSMFELLFGLLSNK